jgi:hypothetical protein
MQDFEDNPYLTQDDDFDFQVQYSDLPLDENDQRSVSGSLVLPGLRLFSRAYSNFGMLLTRALHLLYATRAWLLADAGSNRFADGTTKAEIELEIMDLPNAAGNTRYARRFMPHLAARFSLKMRLWRVLAALVTIILAMLLIFTSFPGARAWVDGVFARPTTTYSASAITISIPSPASSSQLIQTHSTLLINTGPSQPVAGSPVVISGHNPPFSLKPGFAPQGPACPLRPLLRGSNTFGYAPVLVKGFYGLYATLYLSPMTIAVPAFPNGYGWSTTVEVEVPVTYGKPISLYGENLNDGTSIYFETIPGQGFNDIIILNEPGISPASMRSTDGKFNIWIVNMFFSSASCDYLEASFPGGRWMLYFSVGR